jgi:hypothetical protein
MTLNRMRHVLLLGSIGAAAALAACGGAEGAPAKAPMAKEPDTADQKEPTSVAEAQDQIDRARARLADAENEKKKSEKEIDKDSAAPAGGAGSTPSSTTTVKPGTAPAREETAKAAAVDSCTQSCRALSSMRRAVSALCRMTGDTDNRCSDARRTLSESESRVAGCHCGS